MSRKTPRLARRRSVARALSAFTRTTSPPAEPPSAAATASYAREPSVLEEQIADGLGPTFAMLQKHRDPKTRGYEFETLLQRLFRMSAFDAERNPAIAHPRQTDLLARLGEQLFLLEAKWQQEPIDIDDLDSIHARMRRAPRGTIGCFFAMSKYSASAIERANRLRDSDWVGNQILLFAGSEVTALMNGWCLLRDSIEAKLQALRERGETLVLPAAIERRLQLLDIPFPSPSLQRSRESEDEPASGRAYNFAFGELPPEFDTWEQRKQGFELYGPVDVDTYNELMALLQLLHSKLRFSGQGGYSITELRNEKVWFGTSPARLVTSLADIASRYRRAKILEAHHSEEFSFYDATRFGVLFVFGRHRVASGKLHGVHFELRMSGIPLDLEPLRSLTRTLGYKYEVLTPIEGDLITKVELPRGREPLQVPPLEYIHYTPEPEFISAAVVKNPFYRLDVNGRDEVPHALREISVLAGQVRDFLADDERVREFHVRELQILHFREGSVFDATFMHDEDLRYRVG